MTYRKQSSSLFSAYWLSSTLEPGVGCHSFSSLLAPVSPRVRSHCRDSWAPYSHPSVRVSPVLPHGMPARPSATCMPALLHSTASSGLPKRVSRQVTLGSYGFAMEEDGHFNLHERGSNRTCLPLPGSPCKVPGSCPPRAASRGRVAAGVGSRRRY